MSNFKNKPLDNFQCYVEVEIKEVRVNWSFFNTIVFLIIFGIAAIFPTFQAMISFFGLLSFLLLAAFYILMKARGNQQADKHKLKEQLFEVQKIVGNKILLADFKSNYSFVETISVIGLGYVGKTTLIENLCEIKNRGVITQDESVYIYKFSNSPDLIVGMIDVSGQDEIAQLAIALESNFLIIMLDHNTLDDGTIDKARLSTHELFISGLRRRIDREKKTFKWVHFLLNKDDLRKDFASPLSKTLEDYLNNVKNNFKIGLIGTDVTSAIYSNIEISKRQELITKIKSNLIKK